MKYTKMYVVLIRDTCTCIMYIVNWNRSGIRLNSVCTYTYYVTIFTKTKHMNFLITKLTTIFFLKDISLVAVLNVSVFFSINFGTVKKTMHARHCRSQLISRSTFLLPRRLGRYLKIKAQEEHCFLY